MNWLTKITKVYDLSEGMASVFGLVMYTDIDVYVKKMLSDEDYWQSLSKISGNQWVVFAIKATKEHTKSQKTTPGTLRMMVPIPGEPDLNRELLEDFEIESIEKLPLIIIFTLDENNNVISYFLPIDGTSIDSTYNSIRSSLKLIANALRKVDKENLRNIEGLNNAIGIAIDEYETWRILKRGFKVFEKLKSLLP